MSKQDLEFNKNDDHMRLLLTKLERLKDKVALGGGVKRIEKHKAKGKMTARERIAYLVDDMSEFIEIGTLAGHDMYKEHGGCPSGGVVGGIGKVADKLCVIVANDATVKAGAWFPITGKKNLRLQEIAMENHLPIIYLVDSAGVYLPMQDEIFPDKEHFGRIFRNNAKMSAAGIPQIAAIMGSCVAGGAYLPIMSDEAFIVEGTGSIFLAGPYLVRAAIGEDVDEQTLGGAETHCEISGVTDYQCKDDEDCLNQIKRVVGGINRPITCPFDRIESVAPLRDVKDAYGLMPADRSKPYDVTLLIQSIIDANTFQEYKAGYGKSIVCGYARIDGWSVGIVANERKLTKTKKGEMHFGGVIYSDSADKAARFVMNCNQKGIPLVFLQDVTGFMVGSKSEHGGIIKDGAKLVSAVANSVVPKFTIVTGNSYGAGNYAMCGKAYDPRLIVAWPGARMGVMGGAQAAKTLLQIESASRKRQGEELDEKAMSDLKTNIEARYEEQTQPEYAAARLWIDDIIDPADTRQLISTGISCAQYAPALERFNPGVIQT